MGTTQALATQALVAQTDSPGIGDNAVLDEWRIPFGDWIQQGINWLDAKEGFLEVIEWPFRLLIKDIVEPLLLDTSWVLVVIAMTIVATLARNIRVGAFTAVGLTICGLLGNEYWKETSLTIGYIAAAVLLCVIVGIPLGVACGRFDGIWKVTRPILDAMQVVHSFVYMLPAIYFWGTGAVSATIVTMVFALPPLVRLTNLGIRQVDGEVVEAARAYGASEARVLTDVQLPLARPAILTGVNQTLLMAISMLGITAIMGAKGLGRLLFRAINQQDVSLGASAGLAFFLVAVILDRITQREGVEDKGFMSRIRNAWAFRKNPEGLLEQEEAAAQEAAKETAPDRIRFAQTSASEYMPMGLAVVGSIVAVASLFLTWTSGAGKFSAFSREADTDLAGQSFNGLAASGGSWFGIIIGLLALFVIASVAKVKTSAGRGPRWLSTDGAALAAVAMLITALGHLLGNNPPDVDPGTGIGVWVALIGAIVASVGTIGWLRVAPSGPLHPLASSVVAGRLVAVAAVSALLFGALFSGWIFDERGDEVNQEERNAMIEDLKRQAEERPEDIGVIASQISVLNSVTKIEGLTVLDGKNGDGSQLGIWILLAGLVGAATSLGGAGVFGLGERRQWLWSAVTAGIGAGIVTLTLAYVGTLARATDANVVSGIGAFMAMCAGALMVASTMGVLGEFRRSRVYADAPTPEKSPHQTSTDDVDTIVKDDTLETSSAS